jgi:PAS domain S-box-containing protein
MMDELRKLRELTETLTGNGYLSDQAQEWEDALDAIPDFVYIINNRSEIRFTNKALAERLSSNKDDLYGKKYYEIICDMDKESGECSWESLNSDRPIEGAYLSNLKGWFDISRSPIYTKSKKLIGYICVLQEVTDKREAINSLIEREATLEAVFDAAPVGIGLLNSKDFKFISINKYLSELVGYNEVELACSSIKMLFPNVQEFGKIIKTISRKIDHCGAKSFHIETKFRTKDCNILDVFLRVAKIKDDDRLVITVSDITRRKRREKAIKLNEDRLESVLKLTKMSSSSEEVIIEYALEEAVRLTSSDVGYVHFVNNYNEDLREVDLSLFKWSKNVDAKCEAEKVPHYPLTEAGCWADCVRTGTPVVHNDYKNLAEEEGKKGLPEGHIDIKRHMSVPVLEDVNVVAVAGVGNKSTPYNKRDLQQLDLFMNSMWDLLKRKRAEKDVIEREGYFERLVTNAPMGIFVYELIENDLILRNFNPAAQKILNMTSEDRVGKALGEIFPNLSGEPIEESYKKIAAKGGILQEDEYEYEDDNVSGVFSVFAFQSRKNKVAVFFNRVEVDENTSS